MENKEIQKILDEIKLLEQQKKEGLKLNGIDTKGMNATDVERAYNFVEFVDTLKPKEVEEIRQIQKLSHVNAEAIMKLARGIELNDMERIFLLKELNSERENLVSSKHIRLTITQSVGLEAISKNNHTTPSKYLRDLLVCDIKDKLTKKTI